MKLRFPMFAALALCACATLAQNAAGISRSEITIGTIQDLSGPLASYGKQIRNGMMMPIRGAGCGSGIVVGWGGRIVIRAVGRAISPSYRPWRRTRPALAVVRVPLSIRAA